MEEIDQEGLLELFEGFQRGEQVILGHFGTVQTLLALIYGVPVTVHLVNQSSRYASHALASRYASHALASREASGNEEASLVIIRTVNLKADDRTLCVASSWIPRDKNRKDVLLDIMAGGLGLGQIIFKHNIPSKRYLLKVGRDVETFTREYVIEGPDLYLKISEVFMRKPFMDIGWV